MAKDKPKLTLPRPVPYDARPRAAGLAGSYAGPWREAERRGMMLGNEKPGGRACGRVGDAVRVPVAQLDRAPAF